MSSSLALSPPAPSHQPGLVPPPAVVAQPPFRGQAPTLSRLESGPQVIEPCFSRPPYLLGAPLAVDRGAHADPARSAQTDASAGLIAVIAAAAAAALVPEREKKAASLRVLTFPAPGSSLPLSSSPRRRRRILAVTAILGRSRRCALDPNRRSPLATMATATILSQQAPPLVRSKGPSAGLWLASLVK